LEDEEQLIGRKWWICKNAAEKSSVRNVFDFKYARNFFPQNIDTKTVFTEDCDKSIQHGEMSDAKEIVEEIIDRLLADMEIATEVVTVSQTNYDKMGFNWKKVQSIYQG
jgi:hypothetical protein